jgi:hypothetical protein
MTREASLQKEVTMLPKPKKLQHTKLAERVAEVGARAENDADAGAQAQINSIAAVLGVRWDGGDWVPVAERRDRRHR